MIAFTSLIQHMCRWKPPIAVATRESGPETAPRQCGKSTAMLDKQYLTSIAPERDLRAELGGWLKSLREDLGLSQRELAAELSLDYYTFISQLETGRGKIPSSRYADWAKALGQEPRSFVKKLISHYDPSTYNILFGDQDSRSV